MILLALSIAKVTAASIATAAIAIFLVMCIIRE